MPDRILSIDGGGVRGVIPSAILESLEEHTGKLTRDTFSFCAGTSTGALITAAVAAGIPAKKISEIYLNDTKEIFSPGAPWGVAKRVITGSVYNPKTLRKVLSGVLGGAAKWTLNDCPIDVLITAKRVSDGKPWYFTNDKQSNARTTGKLNLVDCAVASACAPTYFPPWNINGVGAMVDGGVGVTGNPVYQAVVEACDYDVYSDTSVVLSLGTGYTAESNSNPSGLLGWLGWTLNELLDSPEEQQTQLVMRERTVRLTRIDPALTGSVSLDDYKAVPSLYEQGKKVARSINWDALLKE